MLWKETSLGLNLYLLCFVGKKKNVIITLQAVLSLSLSLTGNH